ncbi:zf-HC2 domain-containing protein, partial [Streptomyces sp. NPDC057909]|uniref:zf-HC2 domain-containing protein n=1 Tax=Streptomyces sp. NPDC057909 TaxID=3346277 RepID=UPI0036E7D49F
PHTDVAGYVLGILDAAETEAFEDHLLTCPDCSREAAQLGETAERLAVLATPVNAPAPALLDASRREQGSSALAERQVPVGALTGGAELLERTLAATAADRRTTRRRRLVLVAAAAAAIIAGPVLALKAPSDQEAPPTAATAVPSLAGQTHTTRNPDTGVTATAALQPKAWGTVVTLQLSGVKGPQTCRLLAVGTDGRARPIGDWRVPAPGYGVPGKPQPLTLTTATDLPPDKLGRLEVRTTTGETLATIPT